MKRKLKLVQTVAFKPDPTRCPTCNADLFVTESGFGCCSDGGNCDQRLIGLTKYVRREIRRMWKQRELAKMQKTHEPAEAST